MMNVVLTGFLLFLLVSCDADVGVQVDKGSNDSSQLNKMMAIKYCDYMFANDLVYPIAYPIAKSVVESEVLDRDELVSLGVVEVEHIKGGVNNILFDELITPPPSAGMVTGFEGIHNLGIWYPADVNQPNVMVRVNVEFKDDEFVGLHLIVQNPIIYYSSMDKRVDRQLVE